MSTSKKYKLFRFGILHNKKVVNRRFFRYCLVHSIKFTEFMSDNTPESNKDSGSDTSSETKSFSEKYSDVMGNVNETLGNVDWTQMGKYGKAAGIIAVVVIAQIIIKVVIDTINFFPILPGLLELLGVIVVGQWSWQNLRTSENREAVLDKVQNLKKTYLG